MGSISATLLAVADRCEREEPNDELNWSIMEAVRPDHGQTQATPYGHSLDAAVTLVPEGMGWSCGDHSPGGVRVGNYLASVWAFKRSARIDYCFAKTPALALCAAALRARAALSNASVP